MQENRNNKIQKHKQKGDVVTYASSSEESDMWVTWVISLP